MKPDDQLSLGFENSGTKSATLKVDTVRRWAMNRQYPLCYQEENVKNGKCSLSEMNLPLKQMQLSWLSKHNQVRGCQNDAWNIQKHLVMYIAVWITKIWSPHVQMLYIFITTEQTEGDDVEIGCPITCGDCKAVLLVKKFVCPGINVKCVKVGIHSVFKKNIHIDAK